ncbi:MAG: endoribonuclease MazF [Kiloniellales bacterium]
MNGAYAPERGDIIWLTFDPQAGREQAGRRPALVLSPASYNRRAALALVCPITSRRKGYPFEVSLPAGLAVSGVVLADHLKSIDWTARRAEPAGTVGGEVLREVISKLRPLLGV